MPELSSWPSIGTPIFQDPPSGAAADFTHAYPVGIPQLSCPIIATTKAYLLKQDFMQYAASWAALSLGTAYPGSAPFTNYVLVEEGPRQDMGGGVVRWTRTYAQVPDSHDEYETYNYSFIGLTVSFGSGTQTRERQQWRLTSQLKHDYFLVGGGASITDPITGTVYGSGLSSAGAIDQIMAMQYVLQETSGSVTYGGITAATDGLNLAASAIPTWPTSEQYQAMVADALANKWSATRTVVLAYTSSTLSGGPPPTSGHAAGVIITSGSPASVLGGLIPVDDSQLDRWMGPIYLRRTRYMLAR